ncbi:M15 family metallopeptidase [Methyloligella solikamskensis]|uniref:D-alanyl-D-alanine dipeptidase n=1 Tax=Methyloligella solikamskensis TaxID=1177756 RepID=A0ABW3JB32_9HYPH
MAADSSGTLPEGFVYLRDVAPSIRQEMRYAGPKNFTGKPVPGYEASECILARPVAEALKAVQADLEADGLSLKVYDCYRPTRAVDAFVGWAKAPDDPQAKRAYYPNLTKGALFPNYIATRSGHSRGATVDVTLVPRDAPEGAIDTSQRVACTQADPGDDSLDMGTSFDCFDTKANTAAPGLTADERRNRQRLVDVMAAPGFKNYPKEFWHYTFKPEPYPSTYFDFPILPRRTGGGSE